MTSRARELAQVPSVPSGRRNVIINGDMKVSQRGTSFSSNDNIYTLDRMRRAGSSLTTAVFDVEQSTDSPDNFSYSYKTTTSTAEGSVDAPDISYGVAYRIEAQDVQHLGYSTSSAKPITISFWVKSSVTGTYVLSLYNADNVRNVGKTYTISSANTWEYKTLTFAGDTADGFNNDNGSGLELYFMTGAGTDYTSGTLSATWEDYIAANFAVGQSIQLQNTLNATWQITGLQLEVGNVATEFEYRSFGEELNLCRRYYESSSYPDGTASTNNKQMGVALDNSGYDMITGPTFMVTKRDSPTMNVTDFAEMDGSGVSTGAFTAYEVGHDRHLRFQIGASTTTGVTYRYHYTADAEL